MNKQKEALKYDWTPKDWGETESRKKAYLNMRSIHSCKLADTYSLSRAILCLCTKSTGLSAQARSFT
ncbi:unnamed protein product, partial [Sphenostylis stenocarpa]